jgi:dTDP-4-amino-4,6-dideoxygalactose transaminase
LIEDAAQAHGCKVDGKHVGTFGSAGCFSFYPTKNMTTGEGGIIITNDKEVAEKARLIRNHGQTARYEYKTLGFNFRLTELAAAIGIEQLKKLDKYNLTRRKNATQLNQELENLEWIDLPEIIDSHVFHLYTVRVKSSMRERFLNHLKSKDIIAGVYYPKALYEYDHLKRFKAKCPVTDVLTREVVSIPVHHGLNEHDINRIIEAIKSFKP